MTFEEAVAWILQEEGGLSEDPHDPGGVTKYGISQRAYPELDIRGLTVEAAMGIYRRDYWDRTRCEELPGALRLVVFNAAVLSGVGAATRMLQQAVGVVDDGVIGPVTLRAAHARVSAAPHATLVEFCARCAWRLEMAPGESRYGLGWFRRLFRAYTLCLRELEGW